MATVAKKNLHFFPFQAHKFPELEIPAALPGNQRSLNCAQKTHTNIITYLH